MKSTHSTPTSRGIADYCDLRLAPLLTSDEVRTLQECLMDMLERNEYLPYRGNCLDLKALAGQLEMDPTRLARVRASLQPIFDAVVKATAEYRLRPQAKSLTKRAPVWSLRGRHRCFGLWRPLATALLAGCQAFFLVDPAEFLPIQRPAFPLQQDVQAQQPAAGARRPVPVAARANSDPQV